MAAQMDTFMPNAAGAGMAEAGGGQGFDFGSLLSNPLVLQMMAAMGANLDPQGAAGAIGGVTNQWIQNKSYLEMMKKMLGGGKMTFDGEKDTYSFTGTASKLAGALGSGGEESKESKDKNPYGIDFGYNNFYTAGR